jgi:cytolysin-activating lysine-acyltransferase
LAKAPASSRKPLAESAKATAVANDADGGDISTISHAPSGQSSGDEKPVPTSSTMGDVRQQIQLRMGQLLLAAARLPRYRDVSVKTLMAAMLEPLQRNRIAFAHKSENENDLIGMAIWASVSEGVSSDITSQIEAGTFPVKLKATDWNSGDRIWLLDIIVPSRKAGTVVFSNFSKLIGDKSFRLHPIVAGSLDPEIVSQINALASGQAGEPQGNA